jgi:lysophospholipase L1-like esterase
VKVDCTGRKARASSEPCRYLQGANYRSGWPEGQPAAGESRHLLIFSGDQDGGSPTDGIEVLERKLGAIYMLPGRMGNFRSVAQKETDVAIARWKNGLALMALSLIAPGDARADYSLRDGDTVVFLGDSITAARTYGKIIENFTLLRFPGRKVRFINAGWGGDTAAGGLGRLERDVFARGATVLVVAYGVNDIGWGLKADEEHKKIYLDSIRGIVERCRGRKVRVFIGSAAITAEDPDKAEGGFLQRMCDEGLAIARESGEGAIDIQSTMRAIQRKVRAAGDQAGGKNEKEKPTLHAADGVHLNDLGQLAMAFAILKGLGAPAEVSSVTVNARGPALVEAKGCRVTNVTGDGKRLEFDRLDDGLPVNFGIFGALQFRFVPIPEELNRYMLAVKGMPEGRYEVLADGRSLGSFAADRLAAGVNISSATADGWEPGGPWDAQAALLVRLTDARSEIATADRLTDHYLPSHPDLGSLREQARQADARIVDLQRSLVRPRPFHFVVRPVTKETP